VMMSRSQWPTRLLPAVEHADRRAIELSDVGDVSRPRRQDADGAWSSRWRGGRQGGAGVVIIRR
jgi:hypothetical protein